MSLLPDQEPGRHDGRLARIEATVTRIEAKLDRLLSEMAAETQADEQVFTLDGAPMPAERDPDEPL